MYAEQMYSRRQKMLPFTISYMYANTCKCQGKMQYLPHTDTHNALIAGNFRG